MITKSKARQIVDAAVSYAAQRGARVEVNISNIEDSNARFANNEMTQHGNRVNTSASFRVIAGGRQARVSTSDLSVASIRRVIDSALEIIETLPKKDKTLLRLVAPCGLTEVPHLRGRFDRRVAAISADDREQAVQAIIKVAVNRNLRASGVYTHGTTVYAVGNSRGLFQYDKQTMVQCSITMTGKNSSGWSKETAVRLDGFDPEKLAMVAAGKAYASRYPVYVPPGRYTVILSPEAVVDLVGFLTGDLSGGGQANRWSCFTDDVGKRVLGKNITIRDDVYHPLQLGRAFDDEGIARTARTLVDRGIIRKPVMGRHSAKVLGGAPTGHGMMQPSLCDDWPVNLVLEGGDSSIEEMIRSTDKGIYLTRVWYVRDVDDDTKVVTGMTRDGSFLIEGGKVRRGIKNLRFNVSLIELLKNVEALGPAVLASGEEVIPAVVPAMKVKNFQFSSQAKH